MPLPKNRSRSVKRVFKRVPSGKLTVRYKKPKESWVKCRLCGSILGGVKTSRKAAKSEKAPTRMFSGQLCAKCVSKVVKAKARIRAGAASLSDYKFGEREFISMVKRI